jgi:hypothetical protein
VCGDFVETTGHTLAAEESTLGLSKTGHAAFAGGKGGGVCDPDDCIIEDDCEESRIADMTTREWQKGVRKHAVITVLFEFSIQYSHDMFSV